MGLKLVIVGGVAGGASAATRARRLSEEAEIVMFERGPDVSFANCGLPYYVGGEISERAKLQITTPAQLLTRFRIDARTRTSVESIDRAGKKIRVRNLVSGEEYDEVYDKLVLAPGAAPLLPAIPGIDLPGIFTLRNLDDVDRIKAWADGKVEHAVLLGGGFISLELAENLVRRGIATTVVERNPQILNPFDREMTTPIVQELAARGVRLMLNHSADRFEAAPGGISVCLSSGERLAAQLVVAGIGVRPENQLALQAGLGVGARGGIQVDEHMRTSDPDIYAVGDAIEVEDFVLGDRTLVPLAGPANRQGRIAADNIFGREARFRGTQGTAILGFFDRVAAITGASEKSLRRANRTFRKVYVHPRHHAGYYPGSEQMTLKLLFSPDTGALLGAQGAGGAGVDKRIDVLAVAIQAGMSVYDLEEMELAYAPQFGSAKDPINMAGFVAGNLLRGDHPQIDVETLLALTPECRPIVLDVRTAKEFAAGALPGAINIPIDELRERLSELPKDREIAAYCQVGQRGYLATRILQQAGYSVANVGGGYTTYQLFHFAGS